MNTSMKIKFAYLFAVVSLTACSTPMPTSSDGRVLDSVRASTALSFPDVAAPPETYLDIKNSVVIGEGALWTGRLLASSDLAPTQVSNYLKAQMLTKGWRLLSSVHSGENAYFFCNAQKLMAINVTPKGWWSSGSELTYVASFLDKGSTTQPGAQTCR